jgi:hypothetical protein
VDPAVRSMLELLSAARCLPSSRPRARRGGMPVPRHGYAALLRGIQPTGRGGLAPQALWTDISDAVRVHALAGRVGIAWREQERVHPR